MGVGTHIIKQNASVPAVPEGQVFRPYSTWNKVWHGLFPAAELSVAGGANVAIADCCVSKHPVL